MGFKKYYFPAGIILMILLSGCAQMTALKKKSTLSELDNAYRQAILWSDFEYASSFHKTIFQDQIKLDPMYKKIKVTAYDEKRHVVNSEATQVEQTVEVHYYWIDQMLERKITINPVWEWDAQRQTWYLISELPGFK